jgi:phosphocarrier protein HPr
MGSPRGVDAACQPNARSMTEKREVKILNKMGLHARPAAEFVRCVRQFKSEVRIHKDEEVFSGASILEVLSANLDCGRTIILEATGPDAATALDRLASLLREFHLEEDGGSCIR